MYLRTKFSHGLTPKRVIVQLESSTMFLITHSSVFTVNTFIASITITTCFPSNDSSDSLRLKSRPKHLRWWFEGGCGWWWLLWRPWWRCLWFFHCMLIAAIIFIILNREKVKEFRVEGLKGLYRMVLFLLRNLKTN